MRALKTTIAGLALISVTMPSRADVITYIPHLGRARLQWTS
jgi:hypothetical protein